MEYPNDELALDADLDLWQEEIDSEQLPAASVLFCIGTFATASSAGTCVGTASTAACATCS